MMNTFVLVIVLAITATVYSLGTIFTLTGPSANPLPVSSVYVQNVNNTIAQMTSRWQTFDANCDPKAAFMLMYLHMTYGLRDHIRDLYFDNGEFMANFTVVFAGRYMHWLDADASGSYTVPVWKEAFNYGRTGKSSCLEDLYLGMNAHINYDLGNIVYQLNYAAYKEDYDRVNDILKQQIHPILNDLAARYDYTLNDTLIELTAPVFLQDIMGWREVAWQNGILLLTSPLTVPVIQGTMDTEACTEAIPFMTYNVAGGGAPTAPERQAYCNAHHQPLNIQ